MNGTRCLQTYSIWGGEWGVKEHWTGNQKTKVGVLDCSLVTEKPGASGFFTHYLGFPSWNRIIKPAGLVWGSNQISYECILQVVRSHPAVTAVFISFSQEPSAEWDDHRISRYWGDALASAVRRHGHGHMVMVTWTVQYSRCTEVLLSKNLREPGWHV